jgi:hypothetical protein
VQGARCKDTTVWRSRRSTVASSSPYSMRNERQRWRECEGGAREVRGVGGAIQELKNSFTQS